MTDLLPSLVRTFVPLLVALALGWGAERVGLTEGSLTAVATALVTAVYYLVVRLLEEVSPRFGWLLGSARKPSYPPVAGDGT